MAGSSPAMTMPVRARHSSFGEAVRERNLRLPGPASMCRLARRAGIGQTARLYGAARVRLYEILMAEAAARRVVMPNS